MIDEFKTFVAVVEYNNFTKAANAINLSQPAVSQHIKNLEKVYGLKLIQRSYKEKKIVITPAGEILYKKAKDIINSLKEIEYEIENYKEEVVGKIRIGASYTVGEFYLPRVLDVFSKRYPKVEFDIVIDNTRHICEKVKNLEIDLGLVEGSFNKNEFIYESFREDTLKVAVPKNFSKRDNNFRKKDFEDCVWISREKGSGTCEMLEKFLKENNIEPKKIIVFGSNSSVKEAVKCGLGVTLISESVLRESVELNEIEIVKTKKDIKRDFNYILSPSLNHFKTIEIFIKMIKEVKI